MRVLLHQLRFEQLIFWRNREAAFFTFFLPVIFFVLFGAIYGNDVIKSEHVKGSSFLEAGMIGYGVASTAFAGLAITLTIRRETGVLKRIRSTPLAPAAYLVATLVSTFVVFLVEAAIIVALGRLLYGVGIPDRLFSLFLALVLGAASFAALGVGMTSLVRSAEGSSAVVNAVYLPMAIISGTFFSPHGYPGFLHAIADVLPLTYFTRLSRAIMLHGHEIWSQPGSVAAIAIWGAIGLVASIRGFRWEPRER
jgi:ABC-2 type transport system permease protein